MSYRLLPKTQPEAAMLPRQYILTQTTLGLINVKAFKMSCICSSTKVLPI